MIDPLAKPACFTDEQWAQWVDDLPSRNYQPNQHDWACQDCSPQWQDCMLREGRCSWPDVVFHMMLDGTMEGRRMSITEYRGYPEGRKIIRLRKV